MHILHQAGMTFRVQNVQKVPLVPTFLFLGGHSALPPSFFPALVPHSLSAGFQAWLRLSGILTLSCGGLCFMYVCVCCIRSYFQACFCFLSNPVPALSSKLSGTIMGFHQPFPVRAPPVPKVVSQTPCPLLPPSACEPFPLPPREKT